METNTVLMLYSAKNHVFGTLQCTALGLKKCEMNSWFPVLEKTATAATVDSLVTVLVSSSMQHPLNSQPQLTRKKDQKRQGAPRHRKGYKKCLKFRCAQHDLMVDNPKNER